MFLALGSLTEQQAATFLENRQSLPPIGNSSMVGFTIDKVNQPASVKSSAGPGGFFPSGPAPSKPAPFKPVNSSQPHTSNTSSQRPLYSVQASAGSGGFFPSGPAPSKPVQFVELPIASRHANPPTVGIPIEEITRILRGYVVSHPDASKQTTNVGTQTFHLRM